MDKEDLSFIEEQIGYEFENKVLLQQAFIRRSYSQEHPESENNEILEFIGDKALDFIIVRALSDYYGDYTDDDEYFSELKEGKLTEIKKHLVEGKMLAKRISQLGLQDYLIMGKGDCRNNVQEDAHVKEDLFEAIVGAVALDSDWDIDALDTVIGMMLDYEYYLENGFSDSNNYTAMIQQWCQKKNYDFPYYEFAESDQSGHNTLLCAKCNIINCNYRFRGNYSTICNEFKDTYRKNFHCSKEIDYSVINGDERFVCRLQLDNISKNFYGRGDSKSEARMNAAKDAYSFLQNNDLLYTIQDEIGEPVPEKAINQLQELAQKGYISFPNYKFKETHNRNGNPIWTCECWINGIDTSFINTSPSKKECKRMSAYYMLLFVLNEEYDESD